VELEIYEGGHEGDASHNHEAQSASRYKRVQHTSRVPPYKIPHIERGNENHRHPIAGVVARRRNACDDPRKDSQSSPEDAHDLKCCRPNAEPRHPNAAVYVIPIWWVVYHHVPLPFEVPQGRGKRVDAKVRKGSILIKFSKVSALIHLLYESHYGDC
jgi:hypothetical protein